MMGPPWTPFWLLIKLEPELIRPPGVPEFFGKTLFRGIRMPELDTCQSKEPLVDAESVLESVHLAWPIASSSCLLAIRLIHTSAWSMANHPSRLYHICHEVTRRAGLAAF